MNYLRKIKEDRIIFAEDLPKKIYKNRVCVDWENSAGTEVRFSYESTTGIIKILEYNKEDKKIKIEYKQREFCISTNVFLSGGIIKIINRDSLVGLRFGRLLVKSRNEDSDIKDSESTWVCDCDCGNKNLVVKRSYLREGKYVSCGCWLKEVRTKNITGEKFGHLTAMKIVGKATSSNSYIWECLCDCGNTSRVVGAALRSGKVVSCGCYSKYKEGNIKPVNHKERLRTIYYSMRDRCYNENHKRYKYYGGKGIEISEEWGTFQKFYDDVVKEYINHVKKYGEDNTSIDRMDSTKNYSKNNCRWDTYKEQNNNKSDTIMIKYKNIEKPLSEWCENLGLNRKYVYEKMWRYGWSFEEVLQNSVSVVQML